MDTQDSKIKKENDFKKLFEDSQTPIPQVGDIVKGKVLSASKAEVKLDIDGIMTGVVRGPELYEEDENYADLKPGDDVEATIIDEENENGELELSFRSAGQEKAWESLSEAFKNKSMVKIKVVDANRGGLMVKFRQIPGFLPVSQLAPENYPRVSGGDKGKILEKLRSFAGKELNVKIMNFDRDEDKMIFSEKDAWNEQQKDVISKYKIGTIVEGQITAITDFGVFISFGENLEGLIHISELAWQRIEDPNDLFKIGDQIRAEVINLDKGKIFLSAKKLQKDPWEEVTAKFTIGQIVKGKILKINPFGLFVELDTDIHGLAHISQLGLAPKQNINDAYKVGDSVELEIVSIEPKNHRLGLAKPKPKKEAAVEEKKEEKKEGSKPEEKIKKTTKKASVKKEKKKETKEK